MEGAETEQESASAPSPPPPSGLSLDIDVQGHEENGGSTWYVLHCTLACRVASDASPSGTRTGRAEWLVQRRLAQLRSQLHDPVRDQLAPETYRAYFDAAPFARRGGMPGTTARLRAWCQALTQAITADEVSKNTLRAVLTALDAPCEDPASVLGSAGGPIGSCAADEPMRSLGDIPDDDDDQGESELVLEMPAGEDPGDIAFWQAPDRRKPAAPKVKLTLDAGRRLNTSVGVTGASDEGSCAKGIIHSEIKEATKTLDTITLQDDKDTSTEPAQPSEDTPARWVSCSSDVAVFDPPERQGSQTLASPLPEQPSCLACGGQGCGLCRKKVLIEECESSNHRSASDDQASASGRSEGGRSDTEMDAEAVPVPPETGSLRSLDSLVISSSSSCATLPIPAKDPLDTGHETQTPTLFATPCASSFTSVDSPLTSSPVDGSDELNAAVGPGCGQDGPQDLPPIFAPFSSLTYGDGHWLRSTQDSESPATYWTRGDSEKFKVRDRGYAATKRKQRSKPALYDTVGVDAIRSDQKVCEVVEWFPKGSGLPESSASAAAWSPSWGVPRVLIVNAQVPGAAGGVFARRPTEDAGISLVSYHVLSADAASLLAAEASRSCKDSPLPPALLLLRRFVETAASTKEGVTLKAIGQVENLESLAVPNVVKQYNGRPVLITNSGSLMTRQMPEVLEIDFDVRRWSFLARQSLVTLRGLAKQAVLQAGYLLEGKSDNDLPEQILAHFRIHYADMEQAKFVSRPSHHS